MYCNIFVKLYQMLLFIIVFIFFWVVALICTAVTNIVYTKYENVAIKGLISIYEKLQAVACMVTIYSFKICFQH